LRKTASTTPSAERTVSLRLTHDRLVDALRILGGVAAAEAQQARLALQIHYTAWHQFGDRMLLRGHALRLVRRHLGQFDLGTDAEAKRTYIRRSTYRSWIRGAIVALAGIIATGGLIYGWNFIDAREQRQDLLRVGFPSDLFDYQRQLDALDLFSDSLDSFQWVRGPLKTLRLRGLLTRLRDVGSLPRSLKELDFSWNSFTDLRGIAELPPNLSSFGIGGRVNLSELNKLPRDVAKVRIIVGEGTSLDGLRQLPPGVSTLELGNAGGTVELPTRLPATLKTLYLFPATDGKAVTNGVDHFEGTVIHQDFDGGPAILGPSEFDTPSTVTDVEIRWDESGPDFSKLSSLATTVKTVRFSDLTAAQIQELKYLPNNVQELYVNVVDDMEFYGLPDHIHSLHLKGSEGDVPASVLVTLPANIKRLYVPVESDDDLTSLSKLPSTVEELYVTSSVSPDNLEKVPKETRAISVRLSDYDPERLKQAFSRLGNIEELTLSISQFSSDLSFLSPLKKLRKLDLELQALTSKEASLKGMPESVRELTIRINFAP
jgi:hypothetical protein